MSENRIPEAKFQKIESAWMLRVKASDYREGSPVRIVKRDGSTKNAIMGSAIGTDRRNGDYICRWTNRQVSEPVRELASTLHRSGVTERRYSDGSTITDFGNGHTMQTYDDC